MIRIERLDRRAVVIATAITLVALPSLWLSSRSDTSSAPNVAVAGVELAAGSATAGDPREHPSSHDSLGTPGGAFLDRGRTGDGNDTSTTTNTADDRVVTIAVPRDRTDRTVLGRASYRSSLVTPGTCAVDGAPFGRTVTITNVDNGHSVTCTASVVMGSSPHEVMLHTSAFARIADLTAAPVPVEVSW